jgi:cellulose synthase/poly-beta-1,6-N-acetylglucosamine synthase-like glycosyltransferase
VNLSFLITYHNEGRWLADCLESIVPQLERDDDVIIYDDASDDPAMNHVLADARIRVMRGEKNIGPARGRNELIAASKGTHLHFHDADDLCAPSWRSRVAAAFAGDVDVVFTDVQSFTEQERWPHVMDIAQLQHNGDLLAFALRGGVLAPSGTYRREVIEGIGGYRADLWQSEDYDFHIRLALAQPKWAVLADDLVLIRRHAGQRSRRVREVWTCAVDALEANAARFPASAHAHVARAATRAGSELFAAGAEADAERAFHLAQQFGGPRYERGAMQKLTSMVGALPAEKIAALYRKLLPGAVRSRLS